MAQEARKIVRIASTDLDGNLSVKRALRKIKGISWMTSHGLCMVASIDPNKQLGSLSEAEIKKLESAVTSQEIDDRRLPVWMLNRRADPETGTNKQLIGSALDFRIREDINFMRRTRMYKGIRHELGLPVRGQRTRSSFRKNRTVGVSKKAASAPAKPAAAPKKEEKK